MAHSRSAKKRVRQNVKRRAINRWRENRVRSAVKELLAVVVKGDQAEAQTKLRGVYKVLDQIAAKGTIHKNAAARTKARLTARVNALKPAAKAA